jgi:hypothetical protein
MLLVGCDEESAVAPPDASDGVVASAGASPGGLAGTARFDISASHEGAFVAWSGDDGMLRARRLDRAARWRGAAVVIAKVEPSATVVEVAAASDGARAAVVWVESSAAGAEARAVLGTLDTFVFDGAVPLGRASSRGGERGRIAVAGGHAELIALYRAPPEPCHYDGKTPCTPIVVQPLDPGQRASPRPRLALPAPCDVTLGGIAVERGIWHYAVCNEHGARPIVTLFSARQEPAYAQAQDLLAGCTPRGMVVIAGALWVGASCGSQRVAAELHGVEPASPPIDLSDVAFACDLDGAAALVAGNGARRAVLAAPQGRMEVLLSSRTAHAGSRAAWTGEALVVAHAQGGQLRLESQRCGPGGSVTTELAPP